MRKITIPYNVLYELYVVQNMSQQNVANVLGCCVDVVARQLKEYNIPSHVPEDWLQNEEIILSGQQIDVLYGALLGDGCLWKSARGLNAQFSYTSKSQQHVQFVYNILGDDIPKQSIQYYEYFDKRTDKTYCRYSFRTEHNPSFEKERLKWYLNGQKIVPKTLILNPLICLIWYIGDGALCNSKNDQHIQLSTDCFSLDEVEFLCGQLSQFNAKPMRQGDVYRIYIPHCKIKDFLHYIGNCPFEDYKHKWNVREYKNFCIFDKPELVSDMIKLFNNGYSAGTIARHLGVDRSTVNRHLIKNGLNPKDNLHKKKKVGDDNEE